MRRKPDAWMPLYIAKYLGDTMELTTEQHGAYLLLIMAYWMRQGRPLPDSDQVLAAITKTELKRWKKSTRAVVSKYFRIEGGFWHQKRADSEVSRAVEIAEKRAKAGKTGGEASAVARSKREANDQAKHPPNTQANTQANSNTSTVVQRTEDHHDPLSETTAARESFAKICQDLGYNPNDWQNWVEFGRMQADLGLSLAVLEAAATHHKRVGKSGQRISYIRAKALDLKAESEKAKSAPVIFEPCSDQTWVGRIQHYNEHPELPEEFRWPAKWGPHYDDPATKVPQEVRDQIQTIRKRVEQVKALDAKMEAR